MSVDKVHVMVDLETLDTSPSAVILSIGACTIEFGTTHSQFYIELDPNTQYERTKSQSTIDWWAKQPEGLMPQGTVAIAEALLNFKDWLSSLRAEPIIWANGISFDGTILEHAYSQYSLKLPWKYNAVRDYRTICRMFPSYIFPANPKAHDALSDARHQTECLQGILKAKPNLTLA